jgi:hypothetical protein
VPVPPDAVAAWLTALETRHLADLTFPEVSRALRALSSCYVERRSRLGRGAALDGAGKRAAFALFYGPLHFLLVRHVVAGLGASLGYERTIVDLGCGTGVGGAAWAVESGGAPAVVGVDRNPWAVREAEWTWRALGLRGRAGVGDVSKARLPRGPLAILAAFAANEWPPSARDEMRGRLLDLVAGGHALLVIEPIAGGVAPWWREWASAFTSAGGQTDEWRVRAPLPDIVSRLDRAVGLDHREITGRSIYVAGRR